MSDCEFIDKRIQGNVSVVDGAKSRVLSGLEFGIAEQQGSSATTYATLQLFNNGTTKKASISQMIVSNSLNGVINFGWNNGIDNLVGANGISKLAGGPVSSICVASGIGLTVLPPGFNFLGQVLLSANTPFTYIFKTPVVIPPGFGFSVQSGVFNSTLSCTFEYGEDPI